MLYAMTQGFLFSGALIVAIGAQNAYVLRQGIKHEYVFTTALVCTLCDMFLVVLGVAGVGTLVAMSPWLMSLAAWCGAVFVFGYGALAFKMALHPKVLTADSTKERPKSMKKAVALALAFSLLNPQAYFDASFLLGSIAAQFHGMERVYFGIGAVAVSAPWFFGIAYGAKRLAPWFRKPMAWRILDTFNGCVMWGIAASLVMRQV